MKDSSTTTSALIIVFDGVCPFCCAAVKTIIRHDPQGRFSFASAQSTAGNKLLDQNGLNPDDVDTLLLIDRDKAYLRAAACLKIVSHLTLPWRLLTVLRLLPLALLNWLYRRFAAQRYRLFGRSATCYLPSSADRHRFLDS